jgi:hypothetical protein
MAPLSSLPCRCFSFIGGLCHTVDGMSLNGGLLCWCLWVSVLSKSPSVSPALLHNNQLAKYLQVAELCLSCIADVLIVSLRLLSHLGWIELAPADCCLSLWVFYPDKLSAHLVVYETPLKALLHMRKHGFSPFFFSSMIKSYRRASYVYL